jgi:hypothetical protein
MSTLPSAKSSLTLSLLLAEFVDHSFSLETENASLQLSTQQRNVSRLQILNLQDPFRENISTQQW